jgi:iron complex outermembrane receptor protein
VTGANPSSRFIDLESSFSFWTPRVILDVKPADGKLLYASIARGVKTGGFNTNVNVFDDQRRYDPETTWNYEIGAKTDWLDNRLRFNISAYYTDWKDQQVACQNPVSAFPGASSTQRTYVCNVGQARIFGIEAEAVARLSDWFGISANYAYTDATYKAFVDDSLAANLIVAGLPPIDFDGKRLPYVPTHKFAITPRINVPISDNYEFEARTDIVHQSRSYVRADNLQSFAPKTVVDLRLGVKSDRYSLQFFVNNLFDNDTPVAAVRFFDSVNFSLPAPLVQGVDRRQIGVSIGAGF